MKLIVGLGNPGRKYAGTRHNVGFDVVEHLVRQTSAGTSKTKFESLTWDVELAGQRVLLACPQTYMNLSGRAVQQFMAFHKLEPADLLLICDDLNLPTGKLRLRKNGTAGGQKGLQNTIDQMGTTEFARLRIGIDRPPAYMVATDYVLQKFTGRDQEAMEPAIYKAANAVELFVRDGVEKAMNVVNGDGKAKSSGEDSKPEK